MNILIVGNGGREHAICKKLSQSNCNLFYCGTHDNPEMSQIAKLIKIGSIKNISEVTQTAIEHQIDMAVIGPEIPLMYGLADKLLDCGIETIGPTADLALIETSKYFARKLMFDNYMGQYCPKLLHVESCKTIPNHDNLYTTLIPILEQYQIVLKPDGICGGKGVQVQNEHFTTINEIVDFCEYTNQILGQNVIIEEKLVGEEFSIMSFSDGVVLKHMIPVKDYKRLRDGDKGPNTGSMGSITGKDGQLWFLSDDDIMTCHMINERIIKLLQKQSNGKPYKGILYGSFMKTDKKEIKVIEFNARFGDPECINILELLENDLLDIFKAICNQELGNVNLSFRKDASVFKYLVPKNYPENGLKGEIIDLSDVNRENLICASITLNDKNKFTTLGSRAFGLVRTGEYISEISNEINNIINKIDCGLYYRKDIGISISLNYQESGVNTTEKALAISEIEKDIKSTYNDSVMSKFGDFAGIMRINNTVLVSSTDGVGTKSMLVLEHCGYEKGFEILGNDLVNLNVNDILVKMAHPLFFLDYFGCSKLDANHLKYFIKGVTDACRFLKCSLIKGETAQMPDIYNPNTFDLVGTIVGYCNENEILNGKDMILDGDVVIGLPSNGPHTNGFSLIRKILDRLKPYEKISKEIMDQLCAPHKCYYHDIMTLKRQVDIHGLCHITGGGFVDNPERVLPDGHKIKYYDWDIPAVFQYLQQKGHLSDCEMKRTFNCGIGMLVMIPQEDLDKIDGIDYVVVGQIIKV